MINYILIFFEESDDGIFESINQWIDFMKNLDNDYKNELLHFYFGLNNYTEDIDYEKIYSYDYFELFPIKNNEVTPNFQTVKLIFNKPQKFIFGEIGFNDKKEYITKDITELYCDFDFEAYSKAGKDKLQVDYCNGINILLTNIQIIK